MKTLITGESGTGKTTLGRKLKEQGYDVIDIDEDGFCRWEHKVTRAVVDYEAVLNKEFLDAHMWVCDIDKVKDVSNRDSYIIGMPENLNELIDLVDKIILLECPPEIFIYRINMRSDNDFGKDESTQKEILNRYQTFNKEMIQKGADVVRTDTTIENVVAKVLAMGRREKEE